MSAKTKILQQQYLCDVAEGLLKAGVTRKKAIRLMVANRKVSEEWARHLVNEAATWGKPEGYNLWREYLNR